VCDAAAATVTSGRDALTEASATFPANQTEAAYATAKALERAFVVGNLVTETALTLTAGGTNVANSKPATLDQTFLASAVSVSGVTACQTAVKALDSAIFAGFDATPRTIFTLSSCSYGNGSTATNRCATLSEQF